MIVGLKIEELYINPDNYRYIEEVEDETLAIIAMFRVPNGRSDIEMVNLARDIARDGLNPFEMPIVWFDNERKKYIVIDGNRRISCIKLMTQYKANDTILKQIPAVAEIYKLNFINKSNSINCFLYEDLVEAQKALEKIHQDVNEGLGRKPWDSYAKKKANARAGNASRAYTIIEYLKNHPKVDEQLIHEMVTRKWTSKLERVISFARFKEAYNITFDNTNAMVYKDSPDQLFKMLYKLISDLINSSATNKFRLKEEFDNYVDALENEYKTQIIYEAVKEQKNKVPIKKEIIHLENNPQKENITNSKIDENKCSESPEEPIAPRKISQQHINSKVALRLSQDYEYKEYLCLGEKGRQMLVELESLDYFEYSISAAALCRSLIEYITMLWLKESTAPNQFDGNRLQTSYTICINELRNKQILNDKQHKALVTNANKEHFIDMLNSWIHSDELLCVQPTTLANGWKINRVLVELYIKNHK